MLCGAKRYLYYACVTCEDRLGFQGAVGGLGGLNIPQANLCIIGSAEEVPFFERAPR